MSLYQECAFVSVCFKNIHSICQEGLVAVYVFSLGYIWFKNDSKHGAVYSCHVL